MVRAFAACAVILAATTAAAQSVAPAAPGASSPQPTVAPSEQNASTTTVATALKEPDQHALLRQKLAELNCLQDEIDKLRIATGTPQQIVVKVQALELSRAKLQTLGIDASALYGEQPSAKSANYAVSDSNAVRTLLDQLQRNNIAKIIAEPSVVAVSGRPAQFNVGGEVPIPTAPGANQPVEFKPFGTQIDLLAIARGDERVRLELRARISEIDSNHQIQVGNHRMPAFHVRQIDSAFDLKFGQTAILSSTIEKRTESVKTPRGIENRTNEIELMFLVTPEWVPPTTVARQGTTIDTPAYHTATSNNAEARPKERSLRVFRTNRPR